MATGGAPKTQIEFEVANKTKAGLDDIVAGVAAMAGSVKTETDKASKGFDDFANKGDETAARMDRQTASISQSLRRQTSQVERQLAEMQSKLAGAGGGAGTPAAFENLIKIKGADADALNPLVEKLRLVRHELEQLQAVETRNTTVAANQARIQQANEARVAATQTALLTARMKELAEAESKAATKNDFINSLKEQSAAIGKTRADLLELKATQLGMANEAAPYIAQLRQQEQAMVRGAKAVNEYGKSQGELKAAMRNVPAQFTDIFVSLQTGQAPLTVLLQQGGQLKDMFGGLGPAMKAIGGYALGLINPYTLLAAAVGVLTVAYYQGSQEQDAYVKSLVLTGNAAGATAGQMKKAAEDAAAATGTTVGANAEAIAALASTGKVSADNFKAFSQTVVSAQRDLDIPLKETVKNFEALGENPVKASAKLNESMRYLTGAVYEQIIALEQQGKKTEAAELAQKSYSSAMDARTAQLKANLGTIERGWRDITAAAKLGWDAILNVGRASTNSDRLGEAQKALDQAQKELGQARGETQTAAAQKAVNILKERIGLWQTDENQQRRMAAREAERAEASAAGVRFADKALEVRSKEKKLEDEIAKVRADGLAAGKTQIEIEKVVTALKESQAKSTKGEDRRALGRDSELADIRAQIQATEENTKRLNEFGTVADNVTEGKKKALKIEGELAGAEAKRMDSATRKQKELMLVEANRLDRAQQENRDAKQRAEAIERSVKAQEKAVDAANKESDAIERQNENLRANIDAHGKSATAIAKANLARAQSAFNEADSSDSFTPEMVAARQRALEAAREQLKLTQELDYSRVNEQLQDQLDISLELNATAQEDIQLIGMTETERRKVLAVRQIELRLAKELQRINNSELTDEDKEEARGTVRKKALVDAETAAMKENSAEWTRYFDDLNKGMGDAIETAIFDGSKEGAKKMREVLEEALLRKPLRMMIDATMNQLTGGVMNMMFGGNGGGGLLSGGGGGGGGGGMLGSLFSAAKTGYEMYTGTGVGGTISSLFGAASTGTGAGASLTAVNGLSALQPVTIATNASTVAPVVVGQGGAVAGSGMSTMAAGGIVTLVAALVMNALGVFRTDTKVGGGLMGTLGKGNLSPWEEWREGGTLFDGPSFETANPLEELSRQTKQLEDLRAAGQGASMQALSLQAIIYTMTETTQGLAEATAVQSKAVQEGWKAVRKNTVNLADNLGLAGSSLKDFTFELTNQDLNFNGLDAAGVQKEIGDALKKGSNAMAEKLIGNYIQVTKDVVTVVQDSYNSNSTDAAFHEVTETITKMVYVASEFARPGEKAIDTLTRLSTSFTAVRDATEAMGLGLSVVSLDIAAAASDMVDAFGGLEAFMATTSTFINNFFSAEERRAALASQGSRALAQQGVNITADQLLGSTRDQIKEAVLSLRGGDSEVFNEVMKIANGLTGLWESIDAGVKPIAEVKDEIDDLTQAFNNALKSLKDANKGLLVDILRASGDEPGARKMEKDNFFAQFVGLDELRRTELETAYDLNVVLKDGLATRLEYNSLQDELNALTDTSTQALKRQRDALYESNRAIFDQVQALKTQKAIDEQLPALIARFQTPAQRQAGEYERVAGTLRAEGFSSVTGGALQNLSKNDMAALFTAVYNLGETSQTTKLALIGAASALTTLKEEAADMAADELERAYAALEAAADKQRESLQKTVDELQAVFDTLKDNVRGLYGEVDSAVLGLADRGARFINEAFQTALTTGKMPDSEKLAEAIGDMRAGFDETQYATQYEADRDRLLLAGKLSILQELGGEQLNEAQQQIEILDKMLVDQRALVDAARLQLDATYQGNAATTDVATALAALAVALAGAGKVSGTTAKPGGASGVITGRDGAQVSNGIGYQADTGLPWIVADVKAAAEQLLLAGNTQAVYDAIESQGFTLAQANAIFGLPEGTAEDWAKNLGLKVFHNGIPFVPETGVALLQRGEQVIRASDNPFGAGAGSARRDQQLLELLLAALERIEKLTEENNENTGQVATQLDSLGEGGNALRVEVMNVVETV